MIHFFTSWLHGTITTTSKFVSGTPTTQDGLELREDLDDSGSDFAHVPWAGYVGYVPHEEMMENGVEKIRWRCDIMKILRPVNIYVIYDHI